MQKFLVSAGLIAVLAMAGGGGSSSGGGGGGGGSSSSGSSSHSSYSGSGGGGSVASPGWVSALFVVPMMAIVIGTIYMVSHSQKENKKLKDHQTNLSLGEQKAKELFVRYQADWSKNDIEAMREYMTEKYHHRAALMVKAMVEQERRNEVTVDDIGDVSEGASDSADSIYKVTFHGATATDKILNDKTGELINSHQIVANETWSFKKNDMNELLLDGTTPGTTEARMSITQMERFAIDRNLEYFLDWGTLTLPTRGVIFDKGSFENSDINNYMVGEMDGRLIQMYSYTPNANVQVNGRPYPIYLVGQVAVPGKNYGGIIVMKNKLIDKKPKDYQKYNFEWADFNKKYDVFATDVDKVASFELLNPAFMEYLHDQVNLDFTLEVVDNIIYFYIKTDADVKSYETLFEVLLRAHKELKM
jgi:hypothetical protein